MAGNTELQQDVTIRAYREGDIPALVDIWNEVVEAGNAFPQTETLDEGEARRFFAAQSHTGVAEVDGCVRGLYILHPNNVGRCGHVANASYAVASHSRGGGLGRALVEDSLQQAAVHGFDGLQFNAVVASNVGAIRLYEKLGFQRIGVIPRGFRSDRDGFEDIIIFYHPCSPSSR